MSKFTVGQAVRRREGGIWAVVVARPDPDGVIVVQTDDGRYVLGSEDNYVPAEPSLRQVAAALVRARNYGATAGLYGALIEHLEAALNNEGDN